MPEKMSKAKLLAAIETERQLLEKTLSRLNEGQMLIPALDGGWSVKDVLVHITVWEKRMIRWIEQTLQGEVPDMLPPGLTWDDLDVWNEQTYLEHRDRLLNDVLSDFRQTYPAALKAVEVVSEVDLLEPHRYAWRKGSPLWEMIASNTSWHYQEHNQSIQAWMEKSGKS